MQDHEQLIAAIGRIVAAASRPGETQELESGMAALLPVLRELPPQMVPQLERDLRGNLPPSWEWWRHGEEAGALHNFRRMSAAAPGLGWVFLFCPVGQLRQAALDSLDGPAPGAFGCAALRWRMNDWAREVRQAAKDAAERCLPVTPAADIAGAQIWLLPRENSWSRWKQDGAKGREGAAEDAMFFARPDVVPALARMLAQRATGAMARVLRISLCGGPELEPFLEEISLTAVQPSLRCEAYRAMLEGRVRWLLPRKNWRRIETSGGLWGFKASKLIPAHAERLLSTHYDAERIFTACAADASAAVRALSVGEFIRRQRYDALAAELAGRLATDPSPRVRQRAEYILTRVV